MKIEILGSSGSIMQGYDTTSILINGETLIDAGSAASKLPEEKLCAVSNILLTHAHIDHIKELPFILDTLFSREDSNVTVWASRDTISALDTYVFNGVIWPEIRSLNNHRNVVALREVPEAGLNLGKLRVKPFPVRHIPGSLAYLVSEGDVNVFFSGDTGDDESFLNILGSLGGSLTALFIEVSFPDCLEEFAGLTMHLTPKLLEKALKDRVPPAVKTIAYHIKPKHIDEVVAQLPPNVAYILGGEVFQF